MKKKQVGGHKKIIIFFIFNIFFFKQLFASQILDYETEVFLESLISKIKLVNKIEKEINFKIISDKNINAFVDEKNTIHITSGLIEYSKDYVALLSVLAHEIGHIEKNHISGRKIKINNIKKYKQFSDLSIIAGSIISKNPILIQSLSLNQAGVSDSFINFSKEQEFEADFYSLETLKKLDIYSSSIIELLKTIEKKSLERGFDKKKQRISTHPYFVDRIEFTKYQNEHKKQRFDKETNDQFLSIKSKFLGYSENIEVVNTLENEYKEYSYSIINAKNGELEKSLKKINNLINIYPSNIFLIETKADILFSYGYTEEALKFYTKSIKTEPNNKYAQIRIFTNTNIDNLNRIEIENFFLDNINLLNNYYNNKNILLKYLEIAKKNEKDDWKNFISFLLNINLLELDDFLNKLNNFKKTNDINLLNLIEIIYNENL